MTALEYMERQVEKRRLNYYHEFVREVPEEQLHNIRAKIGYYEAAVEALRNPVRHGRWIEKEDWNVDDYYYTCSACGEDFVTIDGTPSDNLWNFCPNCGAKMDGEQS